MADGMDKGRKLVKVGCGRLFTSFWSCWCWPDYNHYLSTVCVYITNYIAYIQIVASLICNNMQKGNGNNYNNRSSSSNNNVFHKNA